MAAPASAAPKPDASLAKESKIPIPSPVASVAPQSRITKENRQTISSRPTMGTRLSVMPTARPAPAAKQVTAIKNKRVSTLVSRLTNHFNNVSKKVSACVTAETRTHTFSKTISTTITSKQTTVSRSFTAPTKGQPNSVATVTSSIANPIPKTVPSLAQATTSSAATTAAPSNGSDLASTAIQTWKCEPCKRPFAKEILYRLHMSNFHNISSNVKKMAPPSSSSTLKCKYCDRGFSLQFALDKHTVENCTKISPAERKRIIAVNEAKSKCGNTNQSNTDMDVTKINWQTISNRVNLQAGGAALDACDGSDNSLHKLPNMGHSGIYRTPSKSIPCKICNIVFMNCVEYAEHCVEQHP